MAAARKVGPAPAVTKLSVMCLHALALTMAMAAATPTEIMVGFFNDFLGPYLQGEAGKKKRRTLAKVIVALIAVQWAYYARTARSAAPAVARAQEKL